MEKSPMNLLNCPGTASFQDRILNWTGCSNKDENVVLLKRGDENRVQNSQKSNYHIFKHYTKIIEPLTVKKTRKVFKSNVWYVEKLISHENEQEKKILMKPYMQHT